jgi:hypothetical protein
MKDVNMRDTDLRLVQVFLSQSSASPAVFEVSVKKDTNFHCTCPGYKSKNICKHIKFVKARIDTNQGTYPLEISNKAPEEEVEKSYESNESFRQFVLKFGKIEVY